MRQPIALIALFAALALSAPAAAQERTDWSLVTTFKATGKLCQLRFAVPRGGYTVALDHRAARGNRPANAGLTLGGLPAHIADERASLTDISMSIDGATADGLKADWRRGTDAANSRIIVTLPYDGLIASLSKSWKLTVDVPLPGGAQTFAIDLTGSAKPLAAYAACIAS